MPVITQSTDDWPHSTFVTGTLSTAAPGWQQMRYFNIAVALLILTVSANAASKSHVMSLGKPMPTKLLLGPSDEQELNISVRPLYLDTKAQGMHDRPAHDITDRAFVIRRAHRGNPSLPTESSAQRWLPARGQKAT
jgi:hypothetical protein